MKRILSAAAIALLLIAALWACRAQGVSLHAGAQWLGAIASFLTGGRA